MKKRFVAIGAIVLLAISLLTFVLLKNKFAPQQNAATEVVLQSTSSATPFKNAQLGVTVDSWLKIIEIDEYYGRLAVIVENVSENDVEHATLTVKTKSETLTFNVSALLSGTKAALLCTQDVACDPNETYTSWQTTDIILFEEPCVMNEDELEISVLEDSISVKNISGKDINCAIHIYYKDKDNDLLNGSMTHSVYLKDGIKADSLTYIKPSDFDGEHCRIIFTEYDD